MILTDRQIKEAHENGDISIEPFEEEYVQPASYDMRVGSKKSSPKSDELVNIEEVKNIEIGPGEFVLISVYEEIKIGAQYVGRFGLLTKHTRKGLIITPGPQIDPGYSGRLTVGVSNLSPNSISLEYQETFISIEFHRLEEPVEKSYSGPSQGKKDLEDPLYKIDREEIVEGENSLSLSKMDKKQKEFARKLDVFYKVAKIIGIFVTTITAIIIFNMDK